MGSFSVEASRESRRASSSEEVEEGGGMVGFGDGVEGRAGVLVTTYFALLV